MSVIVIVEFPRIKHSNKKFQISIIVDSFFPKRSSYLYKRKARSNISDDNMYYRKSKKYCYVNLCVEFTMEAITYCQKNSHHSYNI